ncbi:MAG: hypothetical protein JW941_00395 [Candidatus Coatesbacteria bacterium]|nr:hypothetical protein [Candidatus Coatesbacteria bacterium]
MSAMSLLSVLGIRKGMGRDSHYSRRTRPRHLRGILALSLAVAILVVAHTAFADWDSAVRRGIIPYWQTGENWYTLLIFVNGSDESGDVISVRFKDSMSGCSNTTSDMFSIRHGEMLLFSTTPTVPTWIPTTASYGYILFRLDDGMPVNVYCIVYNRATGTGAVMPVYDQDRGF